MVPLYDSNTHFSSSTSFDNVQMVMSPVGYGICGPFFGFYGYGYSPLSFPGSHDYANQVFHVV